MSWKQNEIIDYMQHFHLNHFTGFIYFFIDLLTPSGEFEAFSVRIHEFSEFLRNSVYKQSYEGQNSCYNAVSVSTYLIQ